MKKRVLFVSGDKGAALAQIPVAKELQKRGHSVIAYADAEGVAAQDIVASGLAHEIVARDSYKQVAQRASADADLIVVGTSASESRLERAFANVVGARVRIVLLSDGLFNHALPAWRDVVPCRWLAIDEAHAQAIVSLRPKWRSPERVVVTGQPAFDKALELMSHKEEIRHDLRGALGIQGHFLLWWSQGMSEVIEEDEAMVTSILKGFCGPGVEFAARVHPKLDKTVRLGYAKDLRERVEGVAVEHGTRVVNTDKISGEALCLAADVILSITCTEDIKSTLIGGPPVVHLLGPQVQAWMKKDLYLAHPFLPDVAAGLALAAFSVQTATQVTIEALQSDAWTSLRRNWKAPNGPSTQRTADFLEQL